MTGALLEAGAIAGAILAIVGVMVGGYKVYGFVAALARVVHHELSHNGGSSTKDAAHRAADAAQEAVELVAQLNGLVMGHERELGSLQAKVKILEDRDAGEDS